MKTASWIILAVAGALTFVGSLVSAGIAYGSHRDAIGSVTLTELAAGKPDVETAVRARRATAAAFAAGFATLFLTITVGPYRRGEVWAWWALAIATLVVSVLILLRLPLLGVHLGGSAATAGAGTARGTIIHLVVVGVALALDAGRLKGSNAQT